MAKRVLIDTGPIVAILCREDAQHESCVRVLRTIKEELVTCWPVITEAVHLLGGRVDRVRRLLAMLRSGAVHCLGLPDDASQWLDDFYLRFGEHAPDLADAALVLLADRLDIESIFTLDEKDFLVYRTSTNRALRIISIHSFD